MNVRYRIHDSPVFPDNFATFLLNFSFTLTIVSSSRKISLKILITAVKDEPCEPSEPKHWSAQEIRDIFYQVWEKLYHAPDAPPFQIPVDPVALQIPDYFDVVKEPMDLSTIKEKLNNGDYKDPWEFVDDVWLMFNNAWLYNRKMVKIDN